LAEIAAVDHAAAIRAFDEVPGLVFWFWPAPTPPIGEWSKFMGAATRRCFRGFDASRATTPMPQPPTIAHIMLQGLEVPAQPSGQKPAIDATQFGQEQDSIDHNQATHSTPSPPLARPRDLQL
jgi:hypothetical protein